MAVAKKSKSAKKAADPELPFEEAMEQLEAVVRVLEGNEVPLDQSLAEYERGVGLVRQLHERLDGVQRKIEELASSESGLPVLTDFDPSLGADGHADAGEGEEDDEETDDD